MSNFNFVVTTNHSFIPSSTVIMVDGTVPGWKPKSSDFHYDHHREGGSDIQLAEIPLGIFAGCDLSVTLTGDETFITTQVDADACVAAASIILATILPDDIAHLEYGTQIPEWYTKFEAIAYDCDHLGVPQRLSHLADFAAKCVAALKQSSASIVKELGLPQDRRQWTEENKIAYASLAFERGTMQLVNAALGKSPYPGESGEADQYFANLERQVVEYADRVSTIDKPKWGWTTVNMNKGYLLFDGRGINEYVDPRVWIRIAEQKFGDLSQHPAETVTVRDRKDGMGLSYAIGVIPCHPRLHCVEYCKFGVFQALTRMERSIDPDWDKDGNGWGGRKTVGGSSWNSGSLLTPEQVAYAIDKTPRWVAPEKSWDDEMFWCDLQDTGDYASINDCGSAFIPTKDWEARALQWMRQYNMCAVPAWF